MDARTEAALFDTFTRMVYRKADITPTELAEGATDTHQSIVWVELEAYAGLFTDLRKGGLGEDAEQLLYKMLLRLAVAIDFKSIAEREELREEVAAVSTLCAYLEGCLNKADDRRLRLGQR
jgi:hypothetical protein